MLNFFLNILKPISKRRELEKLAKRGLTVGKPFSMGEDCMIDAYCWLISIGNRVALASRVQIITHDASTKLFLGHDKIGKVVIGNDVFIGQGSIILPNVTIGNRVLVGAGSVVTKDIPSNSVAVGNPAKVKGTLDEYLERNRLLMKQRPIFKKIDNVTQDEKQQIMKELANDVGFIE